MSANSVGRLGVATVAALTLLGGCRRAAEPEEAQSSAGTPAASPASDVAYYTCSMHPSVKQNAPGKCPICGMDLIAVSKAEARSGTFVVDAGRRQEIGVRTGLVERKPVSVTIRAVGKVAYDETRLQDVSLKYRGWIGRLFADTTGQRVREGGPLFTLYSPDLYTAQEELLTAVRSQKAARDTGAPDRADYLVDAARTRLRLWDLHDGQIDGIVTAGRAEKYLPILSPASGYVVEKDVVAGSAVEAGKRLYRIASLDDVWVEAQVYESELPLVSVGQEADVTLPYIPGKRLRGHVSYVYPYLDDRSRTGKIRIALANPGLVLKPEMYANVTLTKDLGPRLIVPKSAIVYAGPRRVAFLDLGEGRLKPQVVEIGLETGDGYEVLSGLAEGDRVVTSANFLIGAESRLKSAIEDWR